MKIISSARRFLAALVLAGAWGQIPALWVSDCSAEAADATAPGDGHQTTTYSRLVDGTFSGHKETALVELSLRMKDTPKNRGNRIRGGKMPASGLVYFGQFIDHDLTRDETNLMDAGKPPKDRTNLRTPRLDLDSLYGDGPGGKLKLYDDNVPADRARFVLSETEPNGENHPSTMDDLPRIQGIAVLGDDRNEENLILAQLHVAFLQFHNQVLDCFLNNQIPDPAKYGTTPFERARRFVTWHYQYLVFNEFLPTIVHDDVWNIKDDPSWRLFKPTVNENVAIPVEFTHAAFRFGHSMVQRDYSLRGEGVTPLLDLVRKTPRGKPTPQLRANQVIRWPSFLSAAHPRNIAENIDTLITRAMYNLPEASIAIFWGGKVVMSIDIPVPAITLVRGSKIGLPSGQEMCTAYHILPMNDAQVALNPKTRNFLEERDMLRRTPLWYYILREAEVLGAKSEERKQNHLGGECLGPVGSRLVMDVLLGALEADGESYLVKDRNWSPPEFDCPADKKWQLNT
ncbi:MAG: peroxidase family protein, partial [Chthoniobacterales bacterium]